MTKVAIMQPTYLPWSGYFGLIDIVDIFVIYDDVQFDKRSWQQRNLIKTQSGKQYLTVPVKTKGKYLQEIKNVEVDLKKDFRKKHTKAIEINYSKSKYYADFKNIISEIYNQEFRNLLDLNETIIFVLTRVLGYKTKFIRSSLLDVKGKKEEKLVNVCKEISATNYISPLGSKNYLAEGKLFNKNNIGLNYYDFQHPFYPQIYGDFISHLSVLDMLLNIGAKQSSELISGSIKIK